MPNQLLGAVRVQPTTAQPGEPVFVQVCDMNGTPYKEDSGVNITIQGIEAPARWLQFATAGSRYLAVRAVKDGIDERGVTKIEIAGDPLSFRQTLTPPASTAIPIIQVSQSLDQPYTAIFSLGTPAGVLAARARAQSYTAPAGLPPLAATVDAAPPNPAAEPTSEFSKVLSSLPAGALTRLPTADRTTSAGISLKGSASFGRATAPLQTQPIATSYIWDFGDGQTVKTQSPTVSHDYFSAMKAGRVPHSFDVQCAVSHDNLTVKRTLVLYSAYGLCSRMGTIVPHVTGDVFATNQHVGFSGSMIVHNIENRAIVLDSMACVALSDASAAPLPAPQFTNMSTPITLPANSSVGLGVYIPVSQLQQMSSGRSVPGFTVYYSGVLSLATPQPPDGAPVATPALHDSSGSGTRHRILTATLVRFSHTFLIALNDSSIGLWRPPPDSVWNHDGALTAVSAVATGDGSAISKRGAQVIDPPTNTVAMVLSADPTRPATLAQVRASVQAGLTSIGRTLGAITANGSIPRTGRVKFAARPGGPPPADTVIQAGNICDPDNISDSDAASAAGQQLVCQLTSQTVTVTMPGSFQNALMGDVILSPGGDGSDQIIASLLRSLSHPQYHSHSGIMTENYVQITHCTATSDRIGDYTTGINGAGGIQPDVLQYAWPGSITQSIDAATQGETWKDPNGKPYSIGGFTPEMVGITNEHFVLVPPLVVKPLPEDEGRARPALRKVAATALSKGARVDGNGNLIQKGDAYYCFYCYTKPEIAAGFGSPAGNSAGWAQGLSPAVCSSFVWLCLKENNIPLVTSNQFESATDLYSENVSDGAVVGSNTLDGLFYYSQSERQKAGQVLSQILQNMVLDREGFFKYLPFVSTDIAKAIADQILNMFAFNDPNKYGSSAWQQNPGDANAVSPDNIRWWHPPYFGYVEPLQYLPPHTEQYTISRWVKVITHGTVSGTVTLDGAPISGAYIYIYDGKSAITDNNGQYKLDQVPIGPYTLTAGVVVGNIEYSNTEPLSLTAEAPNCTVDIALQPPPKVFRRLDVVYQLKCDHGDANPWNDHGWHEAGPDQQSLFVNPGHLTSSISYRYDYHPGGDYFYIIYTVNGVLAEDLSIQVAITASMFDSKSHAQQGEHSVSFNVPIDAWVCFELDLECSAAGYHNGPSKFSGSAVNNQQTG